MRLLRDGLIALALGCLIAMAVPVEAHRTPCPDPEGVELVQWWAVETKTDTGGCSVSVNAPDYETAAAQGIAICGGTIEGLRATSSRANEATRWTE